jgi:hypothetical protein
LDTIIFNFSLLYCRVIDFSQQLKVKHIKTFHNRLKLSTAKHINLKLGLIVANLCDTERWHTDMIISHDFIWLASIIYDDIMMIIIHYEEA